MSKPKNRKQKLTRRAFIISGAVIGGGFAIGLGGIAFSNYKKKQFSSFGFGNAQALNPFIHITPENKIKLAIARAEMGQGVQTALAMLAAEELDVTLEQIEVIHPQVESPYANINLATEYQRTSASTGFHFMEKVAYILPYIATGGSTTIRDGYFHYRLMGASAREMLLSAAAKKLNVDQRSLKTSKGFVITPSGEKLSYGQLSLLASQEKPNNKPQLKAKTDFQLIGKSKPRIDLTEKVNGSARFGIDVRLPNMLYASVNHSPNVGEKIRSISNEKEIMEMPGVQKIVSLPNGAAVIANSTWQAIIAAKALTFELEETVNKFSSETYITELQNKLNQNIEYVKEKHENTEAYWANQESIEAIYQVPYLAHATMEPMNCTVKVENGKAKVWVGHQAPFLVSMAVADGAKVGKSNVEIDIKYLGGGFGRKAENDFVKEAAIIAKAMEGTAIQTVWSREEDVKHDTFRPAAMARFKAVLSESGEVLTWENHIALQSVQRSSIGRNFPIMKPPSAQDKTIVEGAIGLAYQFKSRKVGFSIVDSPMRLGFWRSVGHSYNGFFTESFVDELAHKAGNDPYEFRARLLLHKPRQKKVLDKIAELSHWTSPLPQGWARGIAFHESFGSIVAQVIELQMLGEREFRLEKIYCVIDCGSYVNPDTIYAQMEGGIVFGLTAAVFGEITVVNGKIQQNNFSNYEMIRLQHMPEVISYIIENDEPPGGVGEPGTPPIAPALTNALFAATGERIRSLPIKKAGYKIL